MDLGGLLRAGMDVGNRQKLRSLHGVLTRITREFPRYIYNKIMTREMNAQSPEMRGHVFASIEKSSAYFDHYPLVREA
jgi:hypothetical protein